MEALGFLEAFLGDNDYLVGNALTIADLAIATSLTLPEVSPVRIEFTAGLLHPDKAIENISLRLSLMIL